MDKTASKLDIELNKVLASPGFLSSPNLSLLLRYLATNQAAGLKESVIAGEFFGRADYDSKIDSLVRTEVRRLRLKLIEHYASSGETSVARLEIPKGSYEVLLQGMVLRDAFQPAEMVPPAREQQPASRRMRTILGVAATVFAAGLLGGWLIRRPAPVPAKPLRTLAVLPFSVLPPFSAKPGAARLSDDLAARLAANRLLRVTDGSSTAGFNNSSAGVQEIGKALAVEVVVHGSAQAGPGETIILHADAVFTETGRQIWSGKAEGPAERLSSLVDQLAGELLSSFGLGASPPPYEPKQDALDAYLQARLLMRVPTPGDTGNALRLFERSAQLDPAFAQPLTNIASIYLIAANNGAMDPSVVTPKAREALARSLAIDPLSSDAHVVEGDLRYAEFDWEGARKAYFRAIDLNPSSAHAYYGLGCQLMAERRFGEAEVNLRQASQLSPLWYGPPQALVELRYYQKRYAEAIADSAVFDNRFPTVSDGLIAAKARLRQGSWDKVNIEKLRKGQPVLLAEAVAALYKGRKSEAIGWLRKASILKKNKDPRYVSAFALACAWVEAGDREQAIAWLEKSFKAKETDVVSLNIDPAFDGIREDPRCRMILHQLRLRPDL